MHRRATTLIEVLTAIFIMALGLVSLLTLFPLGAAQMARAVQDERAAQIAANATSYFRMAWKQMCEEELRACGGGKTMFEIDPAAMGTSARRLNMAQNWFTTAMDCPNTPGVSKTFAGPYSMMPDSLGTLFADPRRSGPSYPVLVDPAGWYAQSLTPSTPGRDWLACADTSQQPTYAIPRRSMPNLSTSLNPTSLSDPNQVPVAAFGLADRDMIERNFFMLDDMGY